MATVKSNTKSTASTAPAMTRFQGEAMKGAAFGTIAKAPPPPRIALLRPLVEIRRRPAPAGDVRIRVDELVGGELVDRARLRLALPVGKGGGDDVIGDRPLRVVDRVRAEHRNTAAHDLRILRRRPREAVVRSDPRHIPRDMNLHEAPVRRENQHSLRRLTERKRNLPVRRP